MIDPGRSAANFPPLDPLPDRCVLPVLPHTAHVLLSVFLVIVTPAVMGIVLWRYGGDRPGSQDEAPDEQDDDERHLKMAALPLLSLIGLSWVCPRAGSIAG